MTLAQFDWLLANWQAIFAILVLLCLLCFGLLLAVIVWTIVD